MANALEKTIDSQEAPILNTVSNKTISSHINDKSNH